MSWDRRAFLASLTPLLLPIQTGDDPKPPAVSSDGEVALVNLIRDLCSKHKLPGLTAAIIHPGRPLLLGAVGVRKIGSPEAFTCADLVHLGSDTKAMTATMIATVVEEGGLSWRSTLAEIFPEEKIDEGYQTVTLSQLLSHRAGLPANGAWWGLGNEKSTTDQRRELMRRILGRPPKQAPGSKFLYSNVGYALASLMVEAKTKSSWEDLMRTRLFEPLGMKSAGFGAPGTIGKVEQPWGHSRILGTVVANQQDNAPSMGPAGTVHCTMADWSKFIALHLAGGRGEKTVILKPETFHKLQTPAMGEGYAKGWVVLDRHWAGGKALFHNGSNRSWYASAWLAPKKNAAYLVVTNDGGEGAAKACDEVVTGMIAK